MRDGGAEQSKNPVACGLHHVPVVPINRIDHQRQRRINHRKLVSTSLFHTTEERDDMLKSGMESGMNQSYVALDTLLASL